MEVARKNDSRLSLRGGKNVPGGVKKNRARFARADFTFFVESYPPPGKNPEYAPEHIYTQPKYSQKIRTFLPSICLYNDTIAV